jgi:hypothetical protein
MRAKAFALPVPVAGEPLTYRPAAAVNGLSTAERHPITHTAGGLYTAHGFRVAALIGWPSADANGELLAAAPELRDELAATYKALYAYVTQDTDTVDRLPLGVILGDARALLVRLGVTL